MHYCLNTLKQIVQALLFYPAELMICFWILLFSILITGWLLAQLEKEQELHQEMTAPKVFVTGCTTKTDKRKSKQPL